MGGMMGAPSGVAATLVTVVVALLLFVR